MGVACQAGEMEVGEAHWRRNGVRVTGRICDTERGESSSPRVVNAVCLDGHENSRFNGLH